MTDLRRARFEIRRVGALVIGGDFEGGTRAGGGLFEDEGDVLAEEALRFVAETLRLLQIGGKLDEVVDFGGRVVNETQKAAVLEIDGHGAPLGMESGLQIRGLRRSKVASMRHRAQGVSSIVAKARTPPMRNSA